MFSHTADYRIWLTDGGLYNAGLNEVGLEPGSTLTLQGYTLWDKEKVLKINKREMKNKTCSRIIFEGTSNFRRNWLSTLKIIIWDC